MNTIPSIFNERQVNRTILGGSQKIDNPQFPVTALILNQGGSHYRAQMLETLTTCGFEEVISIEGGPNNYNIYNIEDISHQFPQVKFVVPLEPLSDGEMINLGMSEASGKYVLVLRDTLSVAKNIMTARTFEVITQDEPYCVVPRITFEDECITKVYIPLINKKFSLDVIQDTVITDLKTTLFPQNFIALYNRRKFIELGGYDWTIKSPYYQNLDLSFRAWLWGEKIKLSTVLNISYNVKPEGQDSTANFYSTRFFLKNLAPRFIEDHCYIPSSGFFRFWRRSGCGFFEARKQFKNGKKWVDDNKFRFKRDAADLIETWRKK